MTKAASTGVPSPAADRHDLIRVHGARENNLKDISVELPKRRLTVFTGVSGSGKSSLVFGTIAAESQRLINETYSAFVQGFMPTLARPDVDVLDGLTTAIIVDQQRMGADPRSTVGTATDANAMLRILFSRLGQPYVGPPQAFSFNVASVSGAGAVAFEKGGKTVKERRSFSITGGMCPRCEGRGSVSDIDLTRAVRRRQVAERRRAHHPRLHPRRLGLPALQRVGVLRPGQADRQVHQEGAARLPVPRAGPDEDRRHQPDLRGPGPAAAAVHPVEGPRGDAAAHPRLRGARRHVHHLPGLRRHPARRARQVSQARRDQHRRRVRDADQRPGRLGARPERAVGGAAAGHAGPHPRLVRRDRARLPVARPAVEHPVRRRGAAGEDDPPARLLAHRRHLRLRRADDRPAPARHRADERAAAAPARQGQHGADGGAQAGGDRDRRPRRRPRPRRRRGGRHRLLRGQRRRPAVKRHRHRPPPRRPGQAQGEGAHRDQGARGPRREHAQSPERERGHPPRCAVRRSPGWPGRARAR